MYVKKNFFQFPIKMYDVASAIKAEMEEDRQEREGANDLELVHVDWIESIKSVKPENIEGWLQSGHRTQTIADLEDNGFPCTLVSVKSGFASSTYECTWDKYTFEKELDKFYSTYIA